MTYDQWLATPFRNDDEPIDCGCVGDAVCCRCLGHVEANAECPCEPPRAEPSRPETAEEGDVPW